MLLVRTLNILIIFNYLLIMYIDTKFISINTVSPFAGLFGLTFYFSTRCYSGYYYVLNLVYHHIVPYFAFFFFIALRVR